METLRCISILMAVFLLCGCPSSGVMIFRNELNSPIYIKSEKSEVVAIPPGSEVGISIELAVNSVMYSNDYLYNFSEKDTVGFKSEQFESFNNDKYGPSTRACIIKSKGMIFLARKKNNTGEIVFPGKQPENFPVRMNVRGKLSSDN